MSEPITWQNLPMSQTDPTTIGEFITAQLNMHNDDPTSHLSESGSLTTHRTSDIIDHFASSIVPDKVQNAQAAFAEVLGYDLATVARWTEGTPAVSQEWKDVCYGGGQFVAVSDTGTGNRVMTSPDGLNWTIRTSAADYQWAAVCYGNGRYVAVTNAVNTTGVMTSPDGITWTLRSTPVGHGWFGVAYGNGIFVAVGGDSTHANIMTSTDGITWTARTPAAAVLLGAVCYGNSLFVAAGSSGSGTPVMTSPDGITWTARTAPGSHLWRAAWSPDIARFAIVSIVEPNYIITSPDGITWTASAATGFAYATSICAGPSLFAVGGATSSIASAWSTDGLTWNLDEDAIPTVATGIAYGAGRYVAVGNITGAPYVMTSTSGR